MYINAFVKASLISMMLHKKPYLNIFRKLTMSIKNDIVKIKMNEEEKNEKS